LLIAHSDDGTLFDSVRLHGNGLHVIRRKQDQVYIFTHGLIFGVERSMQRSISAYRSFSVARTYCSYSISLSRNLGKLDCAIEAQYLGHCTANIIIICLSDDTCKSLVPEFL
jgi:hypothetical protein